MKKAIKIALIILLAASMLFVLTGCGGEKVEKNSVTNDQQAEEQKAEISMGEWKNNTYENEFLGIKFNLPEGWVYSSDKEIAQMMNIGTELLNDDQKATAELAKLTSVTYVVANNPNTGSNVTIMSEKPVMEVTTEYYINQLKTQLAAVESINYEIGNISKETVAGREYDTLTVTANVSGIELTQKYFVYKMDEYFVCLLITTTNGDTDINNIVKSFK